MIFRLIDSRIIAAISPEVRSRQHIRQPAAAISAIDHRPIAADERAAPRDSVRAAVNAGRVRISRVDEKAGRLPIAAIAENVINAHGFADRER